MLVLSRRRGEKIIITTPGGVRVVVIVIAIRGDNVRMGFEAPDDVSIHREEVQAEIDGSEGVSDG